MSTIENLSDRQKRTIYRAVHRGTKEMDWLLGKYVEAHIESLDETNLDLLDAFLQLPDPMLENWIMGRDFEIESQYQSLVSKIRDFHDLS